MSPERFTALAYLLFGPRRPLEGAAELLGVHIRNAQRFASGEKAVGPEFEERMMARLTEMAWGREPATEAVKAVLDALRRDLPDPPRGRRT